MIVLGLDPGFVNFGWAVVRLGDTEQIVALGVIRTAKAKDKVLLRDDDHRRCQEIARELIRVLKQWPPDVFCAEALAHAPVAKRGGGTSIPVIATSKSGRAWGIVDALAEVHRVAVLQAAPQAIKKKVTGSASSSKAEVEEALDARFDGQLSRLLAPIRAKSVHEHAADALGAVVALLDHDHLRLARAAHARAQAPSPLSLSPQ